MTLNSIIKKLVEDYKKLGPKGNLVINHDWYDKSCPGKIKNLSSIKLIIVGDNPGKNENKEGCYFSVKGNTGKAARKFIREFMGISKDDEETIQKRVLFLNKTPCYSDRTHQLEFPNTVVEESICSTIKAIIEISKLERCKILITGCGNNKLNRRFYPKLLSTLINFENIYFSKHLSNGHFQRQMKEAQIQNLNAEKSLQYIHSETLKIIQNHFSHSKSAT